MACTTMGEIISLGDSLLLATKPGMQLEWTFSEETFQCFLNAGSSRKKWLNLQNSLEILRIHLLKNMKFSER